MDKLGKKISQFVFLTFHPPHLMGKARYHKKRRKAAVVCVFILKLSRKQENSPSLKQEIQSS